MPRVVLHGIYLVSFPFIESSQQKIRPVIVVSRPCGKYGLTTVIPISSKLVDDTTEILLKDLKTTGLVTESSTQIHKITTVAQSIILKQLGCLNSKDLERLKGILKLKFNL